MAQPTRPAPELRRFAEQRTILLRTRKRDGTWVGTPVSIAVEGGKAYIRTYDHAWKAKRLRNFPEIEFGPSTTRGKLTGPTVHATTRLLDDGEAHHAAALLAAKHPFLHGFAVPLMHRMRRWRTLHYEVSGVR